MSEAIHLTKLDFEEQVLSSTKPVLVDFWADWCAPCHQVAPIVDELARSYAGEVAVYKVDVDQEPELAREYEIRSIPTFLFVRDGEVVDRLSGAQQKSSFVERLEPLLAVES